MRYLCASLHSRMSRNECKGNWWKQSQVSFRYVPPSSLSPGARFSTRASRSSQPESLICADQSRGIGTWCGDIAPTPIPSPVPISYEPMVHGKACCSGSRGDAELVVDGAEMTGDGAGADDELLCHLGVGQPEGYQAQDLHLSCCQSCEIGCCVPGRDRCWFRGVLGGCGRFSLGGERLFRSHGAPLRPIGGKYPFANGTAGSSHPLFISDTVNRRQRGSHRLSRSLRRSPELCRP